MSRVIKLNEDSIERLVRRIIKEEGEQESQEQQDVKEKSSTLTRHPAYPAIDRLENDLMDLKKRFNNEVDNAVSGEDGFHSEIGAFGKKFQDFITKVTDLKTKVNEYKIEAKKKEVSERERFMQEKRKMEYQKREQAYKNGDKYSY
jgi:hypothetical protein